MEATIIGFIGIAYRIYFYMILGYVLLSWLPNAKASFVGVMLSKLVEPYLAPFRRFIPPIGGIIDISPIVAMFALYYVCLGLQAIVHILIPS